jgi:hypothetical protein
MALINQLVTAGLTIKLCGFLGAKKKHARNPMFGNPEQKVKSKILQTNVVLNQFGSWTTYSLTSFLLSTQNSHLMRNLMGLNSMVDG